MNASRGASAAGSVAPSRVSRVGSAMGSAAGSAVASVATSEAGSAAVSPRGSTVLPHVGGAVPATRDASALQSMASSRLTSAAGSGAASPVRGSAASAVSAASGTQKKKVPKTGVKTRANDSKKDDGGVEAGQDRKGTRQQAKEERERQQAEREARKIHEEERKRVIKAQQEEIRRRKEAEEAVRMAIERREQGARRLIERTRASVAESNALKEQMKDSRRKALEVAAQAAWSRLYAAAKDNDLDVLFQLLRPHEYAAKHGAAALCSAQPDGGKRQKLAVGVRVGVDWASEELRGGAGNDKGYWSVEPVDVNARGGVMRRTALHTAAARGHLEAVRALCETYDADMDLTDASNRGAVWWGAKNGHYNVVLFLIDAGAHADQADSVGNSPAHVAVAGGFSDILEVLVDAGADLLRKNVEGVMAKDMYGKHVQLALKLKGLGQLQRVMTQPNVDLAMWHDVGAADDPLLVAHKYRHAAVSAHQGREQAALVTCPAAADVIMAVESLQDRRQLGGQATVSPQHPDPNFRFKKGHAALPRGLFLTCLVDAVTGETQLLVSDDGFRTARRVCEDVDMSSHSVWQIGALLVLSDGSALVGLTDGRLMRTGDMFLTYAWVDPGAAEGTAGLTELPPPSRGSTPAVPSRAAHLLPPLPLEGDFFASQEYDGFKPGYVFKMDAQGLGYYRDKLSAGIWEEPSASSSTTQDAGAGHSHAAREHKASMVLGSFGAALLAMASPDANRVFVVGCAPRSRASDTRRAAYERVFKKAQQLKIDTGGTQATLAVQDFYELALHMGHAQVEIEDAATAIARIRSRPLSVGVREENNAQEDDITQNTVTLDEFHEWHMRRVESLQEEPLLLRSRNGGVAFERVQIPIDPLEWAKGKHVSRAASLVPSISRANSLTDHDRLPVLEQERLRFIDVAFGGSEGDIGVALGRYWSKRRLFVIILLKILDVGAMTDGGNEQRWTESEKKRKEDELRAAERNRAARLQDETAQRHKEEEERRRRALEEIDNEGEHQVDSRQYRSRRNTTAHATAGASTKASGASTSVNSKTASRQPSASGSNTGSRPTSPGKSGRSDDAVGKMKKFETVKKEKRTDDLSDSLPFMQSGGAELAFSAPAESILPGFDKSKGKPTPSLGMKNFKNASKKGQVSETPIGSPRAQQMAAKLAALNAILERKKLEKEREAAEARGEVWVAPPVPKESDEKLSGSNEVDDNAEAPEPPDTPTKDQLTSVANLLKGISSYQENQEIDFSDLGLSLFDADPFYDDGYDAPFNQGHWDDNALPDGFAELGSLEALPIGSAPQSPRQRTEVIAPAKERKQDDCSGSESALEQNEPARASAYPHATTDTKSKNDLSQNSLSGRLVDGAVARVGSLEGAAEEDNTPADSKLDASASAKVTSPLAGTLARVNSLEESLTHSTDVVTDGAEASASLKASSPGTAQQGLSQVATQGSDTASNPSSAPSSVADSLLRSETALSKEFPSRELGTDDTEKDEVDAFVRRPSKEAGDGESGASLPRTRSAENKTLEIEMALAAADNSDASPNPIGEITNEKILDDPSMTNELSSEDLLLVRNVLGVIGKADMPILAHDRPSLPILASLPTESLNDMLDTLHDMLQEGERALLIKVVDITRCLLPVDSANSAEVIPVPQKDDLRVGSEAVSLAGSTVASQTASAMTSAAGSAAASNAPSTMTSVQASRTGSPRDDAQPIQGKPPNLPPSDAAANASGGSDISALARPKDKGKKLAEGKSGQISRAGSRGTAVPETADKKFAKEPEGKASESRLSNESASSGSTASKSLGLKAKTFGGGARKGGFRLAESRMGSAETSPVASPREKQREKETLSKSASSDSSKAPSRSMSRQGSKKNVLGGDSKSNSGGSSGDASPMDQSPSNKDTIKAIQAKVRAKKGKRPDVARAKLRQLREFTVDRLLEAQRKSMVSEIEMAEMYKRSVDHELYTARLASRLEGMQGGPSTQGHIECRKRVVEATQAIEKLLSQVKTIKDQSVSKLRGVCGEQDKGLQEAEDKIKAAIKDLEKLPKRDKSEEMKKKRDALAQLLEDLEEDKLYYTFNIEHVQELSQRVLKTAAALTPQEAETNLHANEHQVSLSPALLTRTPSMKQSLFAAATSVLLHLPTHHHLSIRKSATKCCHAPPGSPRTPPSVADADDWSGEEKGVDGDGLLESKQQTVLWDVCKQNLDIIYGLLLQRMTVVKAVEEEEKLCEEIVRGHPVVDSWGSLGMTPNCGISAAGLYMHRIGVTSSGVILAAGAGGVQRSVDRGYTWTRTLIPPWPDDEATCMCVAGETVFVIMEGLLNKSVDEGVTWQLFGRLPPLDLSISNIMEFCDELHGFVGHEASNLYYTCDGGLTWETRLPTHGPFRFVPRLLSACGVVPP